MKRLITSLHIIALFHTKILCFSLIKKCAVGKSTSTLCCFFFQASNCCHSVQLNKCICGDEQIYPNYLAWFLYKYQIFHVIFFPVACLSSCSASVLSVLHTYIYFLFLHFTYLIGWIANNFMLCVCRGEAVRLFHVWHEIFPALPPGETQTHSYGYAFIYRTQFKFKP